MTLQELKERKADTEQQIQTLLQAFQAEVEVPIGDVSVDIYPRFKDSNLIVRVVIVLDL